MTAHVTRPTAVGSRSWPSRSSADTAWVVGLHLSAYRVVGVLTAPESLACFPLGIYDEDLPGSHTLPRVLEATARVIRRLARQAPEGDLVQAAVAISGHVNADSDSVVLCTDFQDGEHNWADLPLAAQLEAATSIPTRLVNDANALAVQDYLCTDTRHPTLISILVGETGVGAGLVVNGRLITGAGGSAGEIGHLRVSERNEPCRCGGRGCLERVISAGAIRATLNADDPRDDQHETAYRTAGAHLGHALVTLLDLINPHAITVHQAHDLAAVPIFFETARQIALTDANAYSRSNLGCDITAEVLTSENLAMGAANYIRHASIHS